MNPERSFSFSRNDDSVYNAPSRSRGGYQVSSGALYAPEPFRDSSASPVSSARSTSPTKNQSAMNNMSSYNSYETYRQQARTAAAPPTQSNYTRPAQQAPQQRVSADRQQRQESSNASQTRKPVAAVSQPQGGHPNNVPAPPPHNRFAQARYNRQIRDEEQGYPSSTPYQGVAQKPSSQGRQGSHESSRDAQDPFKDHQSPHSSLTLPVTAGLAAAGASNYANGADPYGAGHTRDGSAENVYRHSMGPPGTDLGTINPAEIEDEEDDPFASISRRNRGVPTATAAGAAAATAAGPGGFLKGLGSRDASGSYGQVPGGSAGKEGKSDWLKQQTSGNKRLKWMVAGLIVVVIVLAIVGGVIGAVLSNKSSSSDNDGIPTSGKLNSNSASIKSLMNNPNLHKVFPGMDYNPLNAQYPACLTNPPLQNNITADIAVLSQLTPVIRLYGTDCDQTAMVLEAIKDLGLQGQMRIWGGIYLDSNATTNARQIRQMFEVLDKYGADEFEGVIVGNEVLFSQYMTLTQLMGKIDEVRAGLRKRGITSLKVGTADLGANWDATLVSASDFVMANVHPFFGGAEAKEAAQWTYTYWSNNNEPLTAGTNKPNIIAETGWPSSGGNYCTNAYGSKKIACSSPKQGAVAGIPEMNEFMDGWVCSAMTKKQPYFWFEAFDEPWKIQFNTKNEHWESKWGLFDVDRNLKKGLKIPDCGGKVASLGKK